MVSSFGDTCERILCCAEVGEAFLELFAEDFSALIKPCTLNRSGGWNGEQRADFARHMPDARILRTEPAPAVWVPLLDQQMREQRVWGFELGDDWPSSFIAEARFKGWPVLAYTVNDPERARLLAQWGVDAICTDRIDLIGADFAD